MNEMDTGYGTGFAIIMSIVLIVVILYTVFKLRQQAKKAQDNEKKKTDAKLPRDNKSRKDRN